MTPIEEVAEYMKEGFELLGEIIEKSIGTYGIVSKKLILHQLHELQDHLKENQQAIREHKSTLEWLTREKDETNRKLTLVQSQILDLRREISGGNKAAGPAQAEE